MTLATYTFPLFAEQETDPIFGWLERLAMRTALADLERSARLLTTDLDCCLPLLFGPAPTLPHCTCNPNTGGPWDALDCPAHADEAAAYLEGEARAEAHAENGWLRAAEAGYPGYADDPRDQGW